MPSDTGDVDLSLLGGDNPADKKAAAASGSVGPGEELEVPEWRKSLPEPLQKDKRLDKFTNVSDVIKSYVELEGKLGSSVSIPKSDAPAEEWTKFFVRVGRPEKPENYDLPKEKYQPEVERVLREKMLAAGILPTQVSGFLDAIGEAARTADTVKKAKLDADAASAAEALKAEYGDKYQANVDKAIETAKAVFPPELFERMGKDGYGKSSAFVKSMIALSENIGETKLVKGGQAKEKAEDPYTKAHAYMLDALGRKSN